jgi:hypothetical protein
MAEEGLNASPHSIDLKHLGTLEIKTDDRQMCVATIAYSLGSEVDLQAEHLVQFT